MATLHRISQMMSRPHHYAPVLLTAILFVLPLYLGAQNEFQLIHGDCTPNLEVNTDGANTRKAASTRRLPDIYTQWDAGKIYKQLVILVEFPDAEFSRENARDSYDLMLNEPGYNERNGMGCVAEYFRTQSNGLFNLQFDVYGPFRVSSKAQPYDNPTKSTRNYGRTALEEATRLMTEAYPEIDYSVYDWNGDGKIEQTIFICAGYCGNANSDIAFGYLWPNTSSFTTVTAPDGTKISNYSASAERWPSTSIISCGIGTICHEFSHSLGLPDIYPVNEKWTYSAVDEWDLMDGGNFTNYGWCPPNFTALEKMLMGWITPIELTEPTTITDMKPLEEGGDAYIVRHTQTEYLLLENRQWKGWDLGIPGKGLVIYHVNFDADRWRNNSVNGVKDKFNFSLVNADNMSYQDWNTYRTSMGYAHYQNPVWMNSFLLSSSSYPWATDSTETVLDSLTDCSVPATLMYNSNAEGSKYLSKAITHITVSEDGHVSFDFMGGTTPDHITILSSSTTRAAETIYDLQGRRLSGFTGKGIYLIKYSNGTTKKVHKQ